MLNFILVAVGVILATLLLVKLADKFIPAKFKPVLTIALWLLIAFLGFKTYTSIFDPIKFNKEKTKRYTEVIASLIDIRDAQLAHRQVTGTFAKDFNALVKFVDTAEYTITQRKDSSVVDEVLTKRYGVDTTKDIVVIDTLGFVPVKDSLFKKSTRYKTMMNVPTTDNAKFKLEAGYLEQNNINIPVFQASVKKNVILGDLDKDLLMQENQVISTVVGVKGDALKVGSMESVETGGNWPITYGKNE